MRLGAARAGGAARACGCTTCAYDGADSGADSPLLVLVLVLVLVVISTSFLHDIGLGRRARSVRARWAGQCLLCGCPWRLWWRCLCCLWWCLCLWCSLESELTGECEA
jgi:hypothetical protein